MKRKRVRRKKFRLKHLLILLFIFWVGKSIISQQITMKNIEKTITKEKQEIEKLEKEIKDLSEEIEEKDSLDFIEKTAREELKMVKPREIMYIDMQKERKPFVNSRKQ